MTETSRWVDAGGFRFHTRVAERDGAPAVVLVHGIAVSSRYMIPVARELSAVASVYAPDLPGFGRSTKPRRALGAAELADALDAWAEAAGLRSAVVVANSFGCQVAVHHAVRHAARVDRLVLVGPTVDRNARTAPAQIGRWVRSAFHERPPLHFVVARDALDAGARRIWRTFRRALADEIEACLPLVAAPTLVVRGENDPIVSQAWAEEVAALVPDGRLAVVPGAGHALNWSRPRDLARLVRAFLP